MNGDDFKQVRSGDPQTIAARTWNAILDTTRRDQLNRQGGGSGGSAGGSAGAGQHDPGVILFKNPSVNCSNRSSIVVPIKGLFGTDTNRVAADFPCSPDQYREGVPFSCITPDPLFAGYFAVTLEDVPTQKIGRARIQGVAQVVIDIKNIRHEYADIDPATNATSCTNLVSAFAGYAKILSPNYRGNTRVTTGTQWCTVLLGPEQKALTASLGVAWSASNPNILRVSPGLAPGQNPGSGATTNTINLAICAPVTSTSAVPPCDPTTDTAIQYIPFQSPQPKQGTNVIDGIAINPLMAGACFIVGLTANAGRYDMTSLGAGGALIASSVAPDARCSYTRTGTNVTTQAATLGIGYIKAGAYGLALAFES